MESKILETAFDLIPLPLVITDIAGTVLLANREVLRVTGLDKVEGRKLEQLCSLVDQPGSSVHVQQIVKDSGWRGQVEFTTGDSESRTFFVEAAPLRDHRRGAHGVLFVFEPTPVESGAANRQQKLELMGSIAGGVAHDLNNVLTGVLGHVSFLRMALGDESPTADSLLAIEDGAKKAASITNQILEFARGEPTRHRVTNLVSVVASGVNLIRAALPKNISLKVLKSQEQVMIHGDESQLTQIFMNLALNAADALPNGGEIQVAVSQGMVDEHPEIEPGEYARLAIIDNGTGMSKATQERIFQPFFTTKAKRGTGLGLANVFSLVRLHRGKISVQSEEGTGSVFEVFFPVDRREHRATPKESPRVAPPTGTETILVVEDEEIVRTVIQKSLEHLGYHVHAVSTGREAVDYYRINHKKVALVVLDMMMPQMSGDEVFLRLKELNNAVRVLVASGYSSDVRARIVLDRGGLGFIQKPFAIEELAQEVRRCLDLKLD